MNVASQAYYMEACNGEYSMEQDWLTVQSF